MAKTTGVSSTTVASRLSTAVVTDAITKTWASSRCGRPAPRPVWFLWNGTDVVIYSMPEAAKVKHVAANGHVTLNFNSTPGGGDVVVIAGQAEVVHGAPLTSAVPGWLDKYRDMIAAMGYTQEWYDSYSTAIRVTPERSWSFPG